MSEVIENIGIVGGGQLGRMLTEAAHPLGFHVTVLDSTPNCPAAQVGAEQISADLQDANAIAELAQETDVLTWEIEHINVDALKEAAAAGHNIQPDPETLETIQDKYKQKTVLRQAGLPVALAESLPDAVSEEMRSNTMNSIAARFGGAIIVKARKGAYDGRGNHVFNGSVESMTDALGDDWSNLYVEKIVPFEKELSVVAARSTKGDIALYPTVETVHKDNICHTVVSPANIDRRLDDDAQEIAHETLKNLGGAGIFAIEMFATDSNILINEIAPRVHNSGHQTIEANATSQFEQHIRAVTGMPLGSTELRAPAAAMINILGRKEEPLNREGLDTVLSLPDTHPHFYGKSSRAARKIGHITVLGETSDKVLAIANQAREALKV